jgi:hypothetical protein
VQPWNEFHSDDAGAAPPGGAPVCRWPPDPPDFPDLPDASTAPATAGTAAVSARLDSNDIAVQRKLDAFRDAMTATYHTSEGDAVVAVPFCMSRAGTSGGAAVDGGRPLGPSALAELQSAARRAHLESALGQIRCGRGTPEQIRALTQALLNDGRLPPCAGTLWVRIRQMMSGYGIGIDCAGHVQQAYLSAKGLDRRQAHFGSLGTEDLSNLGPRGYRRIGDLSDVRPGDLFVLGPRPRSAEEPHPFGHRAIVYDQHIATATDIGELLQTPDAAPFTVGTIRVIDVDSSWGCHGNPLVGGVTRERWWHNETTDQWAWMAQGDGTGQRPFLVTPTPYDHAFNPPDNGVFRRSTP